MTQERRAVPFVVDQEKFATQRGITYVLILIFAGVVAEVLWRNVETERSTVLQTVINLTMLAVGYWLGASKGQQDQAQSMSRIAEGAPSAAAAAAKAIPPSGDPIAVKIAEGPGTEGAAPLNVTEGPK